MTRTIPMTFILAGGLASLLGCTRQTPGQHFDQPMTFAGKAVPAAVLNKGSQDYTLYCRSCHGDKGDGMGPSSAGLKPPPRDFRQAQFKFGWVIDGMPSDEDFKRIITGGLHGTAMLAWDVPDRELGPITQYIKTFAPDDWKDAQIGTAIVPSADPWGEAKKVEAVERGKVVYHGVAQCSSCHPAYASRQFVADARGPGSAVSFRDAMYMPEMKESMYTHAGSKVSYMPPDFTWTPLRSIRAGKELGDLYSLIGAGIPGTAMPSWKGALPEEDLWALAYYVDSLTRMRGTESAQKLRDDMKSQPDYIPPAPAEPPPTGASASTSTGM